MRKLYDPRNQKQISKIAKKMAIEHNVTLNVIDLDTNQIVQSHEGHNAATNSLLTGIAHYLIGDGVYNQAYSMLSEYIPRYISLGTMGLFCQDENSRGLPIGLGSVNDTLELYDQYGNKSYIGDPETERLCHYIAERPGFGADGYAPDENNGRLYIGLGPEFTNRDFEDTVSCELISDSFPRASISFRDIVPEAEAEVPKTIDIIYSAMISTGALANFRSYNTDLSQKDYIFITEAGLWSKKNWQNGGNNGLLAAYRLVPASQENWDIGTYVDDYEDIGIPAHYDLDPNDEEHAEQQKKNQDLLKRSILRVGRNQVVQVIWKIQLGGLDQLGGISELYPSLNNEFIWHFWDEEN